jgi:site-specific DNA recombinase
MGSKVNAQEAFPLRGFLICPKCGRSLTASASKGKYYRYNYYHCISRCGHRTSANIINDSFAEHLKGFVLNPVMAELYKLTITNAFKNRSKHNHTDHKNLILEITKLNDRPIKQESFYCQEILPRRIIKQSK